MELFDYLMAKKGHNLSTHGDLFSYLLGKKASGGSGIYTTFSGTSLNISNTIKAAIKKFMLNSTELTQDGTPTPDNPVDVNVITGSNNVKIENNIFNINNFENQFVTGKILNDSGVEVSDSGSKYSKYKIAVRANITYQIVGAWQRIYHYDNNGNFISRSSAYNNGINTTYTPSTDEYIGFQVANTYYDNNKGNEKIITTEQNYPIDLKSDNLFNKNAGFTNGYIDNSGNLIVALNNALMKGYIKVKPNTTYMISQDISIYSIGICLYNETTFIGRIPQILDTDHRTFTTNENTNQIRLFINLDNQTSMTQTIIDNLNIRLNEGNVIKPYTPYYNLEYCKIGDYADQIFKNTKDSEFYDSTLLENEWYLKKNIGKVVWNGTENWVLTWSNLEKQLMRLYYRAALNVALTLGDSYSNYLPKATRYGNIENGEAAKLCFLLEKSNYNNVVIPTTNFTDVNAWKDWLSTHNTKVYYQLATPTYIHISETDYPILRSQLENLYNNAKSYKGQTNITQANDDLPFDISVDVKVLDTNLNMSNSLNSSLLNESTTETQNIAQSEEQTNLDDTNETEESVEEYQEL